MHSVIVLPGDFFENPKMKHMHRRVLGTLLRFRNGKRDGDKAREAWPSLRTIAGLLHADVRQVTRAVKEMASLGYLEIAKRGRSNLYRIAKRFLVGVPTASAAPANDRASPRQPPIVDNPAQRYRVKESTEGSQEKDSRKTESVTARETVQKNGSGSPSRYARPGDIDKDEKRVRWLQTLYEFVRDEMPRVLNEFYHLATLPPDEARPLLNRFDKLMHASDWWRKRQARRPRGFRKIAA